MRYSSNGDFRFIQIDAANMQHPNGKFDISGNPDILIQKMDLLVKILHYSSPSAKEIAHRFFELISIVPIPIVHLEHEHIVRCRPGYKDNGRIYSNVADISYNPFCSPGRFNLNGEPIFYGSMPTNAKYGNCSLTTIIESDKDLLNKIKHVTDTKFATLGRWDIIKPFPVLDVCFLGLTHARNPLINKLNTNIIQNAYNVFENDAAEIFILFCRFLSEILALDSEKNHYIITHAFKAAVNSFYGKGIKGFLYSSGIAEHNGVNVALSKETVDDGYIRLTGVSVYKIESHPIYFKRSLFPCSNFANTDSYGNFKLKVNPNLHLFE